ncbi:MAG: L-idonate 5-dehydrogenase [Granulosicoccus sp.]|nr:L-idonate 5-dehydrogenase [Granulosicoccus sp.]
MKALVLHAAKDLRLEQRVVREPAADELVIDTAVGGVCGSDLHYYNDGGFGPIRLQEPMILGHEVSGYVREIGSQSLNFEIGDLVAVSPSRPCYQCSYCLQAQHNHCENMEFYGSAMPMPHIQGAFRQTLTVKATQCIRANAIGASEAAMAEPFAVTLHAVRRAGDLLGKKVLITGSGPIGVLSIIAARRAGAARIVATDIADNALKIAAACGADETINVMKDPDAMAQYSSGKGYFENMFECSGNEQALTAAIPALKPQCVLMQLGLGGDMKLPMMQLTAKEIELRGSFRFHAEYALAVELMSSGLVDVKPLITHTMALEDAESAFTIANDRNVAMKAQIVFN